jgi:hypothetical protein
MSRSGLRIIPRVEDPITQLTRLALDRGWHLKKAVARDAASGASGEMIFFVPDGETYIVLRDDLFVGFQYFVISGLDQEPVAEGIRKDFNARRGADLLAWWDRGVANGDVDDRVDAVLFLGVDSPEMPREDYASRIRAGLTDDDKDVRNAAIAAAGYAEWRMLRPDIERIATADPDSTASKRAKLLLEGWDKEDQASRGPEAR